MHDELRIARSLTWRYVIALLLVATLTTAAWISLHLVISEQKSTAAVVNVSGRQRMLSQRIALFSSLLVHSQVAERPQLRQRLNDALDLMRRSHRGLTHGDPSMGLPAGLSPTIREMYFSGPEPLDGLVKSYLSWGEALLRAPDEQLTPANPDLVRIVTVAPSRLVSSLDKVVNRYQWEGEAAIARLQTAETAVWLFTLALLVLEASFIFRPFVSRIRLTISQLRQTSAELLEHKENLEGMVASRTEDLERKRQELAQKEEILRLITTSAQDAIIMMDAGGSVSYWNPAAQRIFGHDAAEALGKDMHQLLAPQRHGEAIRAGLAHFAETGKGSVVGTVVETMALKKDGMEFPVEISISAFSHKGRWHAIGLVRDITERKNAEDRIRQLAYFDPVTDLPNRRLLLDRLDQAWARCRRHGHTLAVMFLDLDGFKAVNDTLGHDAGDELLKVVAHRLASSVRAGDTVARQGGDEFVILLEHIESPQDAGRVAEKLLASLQEPNRIRNRDLCVTGSMGIAIGDPSGEGNPAIFLAQADSAMYLAKQEGKNRYRHFGPGCAPSVDAGH